MKLRSLQNSVDIQYSLSSP